MKTYRRPMSGWWRRNRFYRGYMLREASSVFVTAYALVLLAGLFRLWQGAAQLDAWLEAMASPLWIGFHGVTLVFVAYHSWTWFRVMPKTLPRLPLSDAGIVAAGVGATVLVTLALLWIA